MVLAALPAARLVGGCVRDHLADRDGADIDLATPDQPAAAIAALEAAGVRAIPTGIAHGTVTALADGHSYEITTLRRDVETDGRHAVVAFTDDWRADAARRDFTINAMSMTPDGTVFDYFGGRADLESGRVRFVGDAATRIAEDYLRILRFFRFTARYAKGPPDAEATAAIAAGVPGLAMLSGERVWSELKRILAAPAPSAAVALMHDLGVLQAILPGAAPTPLDHLPADPLLRLAALHRPGVPALKLSNEEVERLFALQGPPPPSDADEVALRRLLADTPPEVLIGRTRLAGYPDAVRARLAGIPVPVFPVQGRDLKDLGIAPGPMMGQILRDLRAAWLDGGCVADRAALLAQLVERGTP
jgi:poly(A) polymerase/tRNA nucleotidyltransferase (CCA-adding enzyme)